MSTFTGLFDLKTTPDLLQKLEHNLERMEVSPLDQYAAFDFFVTAEHMIDWVYPDEAGHRKRAERKALRDSSVILRVCSHIANGAKHFRAVGSHHDSVSGTEHVPGGYVGGYRGGYGGCLYIQFDGDAAAEFGLETSALELARATLNFWRTHLSTSSAGAA